jgi:hypothetical protein
MSGFEMADLVLGTLPVLVESMRVYLDATQKVKDLRDHKRVLRHFNMELLNVENVCRDLLAGIATNDKVTMLRNGTEPVLQDRIQERLGSAGANEFMRSMQELYESLEN